MTALVFFNAALLLLQLLCNFIQIDTFCFFILRLVWNNELAILAIIFIHYSVRKEQQKTVKTDIFAYLKTKRRIFYRYQHWKKPTKKKEYCVFGRSARYSEECYHTRS